MFYSSLWVWCVDNIVGDPFNGFRIGSEIILECEFGPSSIRKDSSWGEGCPSLIYIYFLISQNNILYIWNRVPVVLYTVKIAIQMVPQSDIQVVCNAILYH